MCAPTVLSAPGSPFSTSSSAFRGTAWGLIAFGPGPPFSSPPAQPLTLDHDSFRRSLSGVDTTDTLPVPGTDIGYYAIRTAREALRDDRNHRVIILSQTTAKTSKSRGLREARGAVSDGFLIFTRGAWACRTPSASPWWDRTAARTYHRDPSGEIVETRFDENHAHGDRRRGLGELSQPHPRGRGRR